MNVNTIRAEIKNELRNAIAGNVTKGTIVLSDGKWFAFTITYLTFSASNIGTLIEIKGNRDWNVNDAASTALYELGYTKQTRGR